MPSKDMVGLILPEKNNIVGNNKQPMQCVLLTPKRSHKIPMHVDVDKTNSPTGPEKKKTIDAMKITTATDIAE